MSRTSRERQDAFVEPSPAPGRFEQAIQGLRRCGVLRADAEGCCVFVSDEWCKLTGLERERLLGRNWLRVMPVDQRAKVAAGAALLKQGHAFHGEYHFRRPDGREIWLESDTVPELDAEGRLVGSIATLVDVTARRHAEAEARRVEAQLRAQLEELESLYRHTPVALCLVDRDLRYLRANQLYADLVTRDVDEIVGRTIQEVVPPLAREQAVGLANRVIRTGWPVLNLEIRSGAAADPLAERIWLVHCHPVFSEGEVSGAMVVVQNITELRKLQDRLEDAQRLAQLGNWEWSLLDGKVWWSEELYRIVGKDPREFTPSYQAFFELVHPEDRDRVRKVLEEALQTHESQVYEFRLVSDGGEERWVQAVLFVESSEDGMPLRLRGTSQLRSGGARTGAGALPPPAPRPRGSRRPETLEERLARAFPQPGERVARFKVARRIAGQTRGEPSGAAKRVAEALLRWAREQGLVQENARRYALTDLGWRQVQKQRHEAGGSGS